MKINTFYNNKKTSVLFLFVFLIQIIIVTIAPLTAYAADQNKAQNEYTSYQAFRLMAYDCIWSDGSGKIFTSPSTWMETSYNNITGQSTNRNMAVGSGFYGNNNAEVNCDDNNWITKALQLWGYTTPKSFLDDLVKTGKGKGLKQEQNGSYTKLPGQGHSEELTQVIITTLKNKKVDVGGLTPAITYYGWLQNFVNQCNGAFSTTDPGNQGNGIVSMPTNNWISDTGEPNQKGFLIYNQRNATIAVGTSIKEDGRDNCESIAKHVADGNGATEYAKYVKNGDTQTPGGPGGTASQDTGFSACSQQLRPFGWVLCPVLAFASNIYESFVGMVNSILFFSTEKYAQSGLKDSWSIFVRLANAILVLVGLVMLAGQIFSFEFFSAYTVKKVLPRLFIGAILIQLSWFIFTTFAQIVNALGSGLYWLLLAPFGFNGGDGMVTFFQAIAQNSQGGATAATNLLNLIGLQAAGLVAAGAVVIAATTGAWLSIVLAFVGILISVVVALVTLMLRESVLIVLLAISPLALAAWILPNTNNLWNTWWKTYSRLLLMYPLIMLLFAGGTIAAHVLSKAESAASVGLSTLSGLKLFGVAPGSSNSYMFLVLEIIAFFAPIFMISMTFKFAGSIFGNISSVTGKLGSALNKGARSGMAPIEERVKGNKQARKDFKKSQAFQTLNDPSASEWQRRRAKFRSGTLGLGLRGSTQQAYEQRDKKAKLQGLLAKTEDENLENKYIDAQAAEKRAEWANQQLLVTGDRSVGDRHSGDFLVRMATSQDRATARAAQQEIIKRQDVSGWSQVQQHYESMTPTTPEQTALKEEYSKQRSSGEFAQSFLQKRADWIKGDGAYESWGPEGFGMGDKSAYADMASYLERVRSSGDTATYDRVTSRLASQLEEAMRNPATRAQLAKNPDGLLAAKNALSAHITSPTGIATLNKINSDGTFS